MKISLPTVTMTVHTIPAETLARQHPSTEEGTWEGMNPITDEDQLVFDRNQESKR